MSKKNQKPKYLQEYLYEKPGKQRKIKKPHKFFTILLSVGIFATLVVLACFFSDFITPGVINLEKGDRYFLGQTLYAVKLSEADNIASAKEMSEDYQQRLAAGYIVNDDGIFCILASLYKTKSNAESVVNSLKESQIEASIYEVTLPSLYMDLELSEEQKTALKNCFSMFYNTYGTLYELSISLDKGEKTCEQCQIELLNLISSCEQTVDDLNLKIQNANSSQMIYTKVYLNLFLDTLKELSQTSTASTTYPSKIKETYFDVIYQYIQLKTELVKN